MFVQAERTDDSITADAMLFAADQLFGLGNATKLEFLRTLDLIERSGAWAEDGATSFENWVSYRYATSWSDARAHVTTMRAIRDLPKIADAFARGGFPWESLVDLCSFVSSEEDEQWADRACRISAAKLKLQARRANRLKREEAEKAQRERYVVWWRDREGFLRINGRLPGAEGAVFVKAIERIEERRRAQVSPVAETFPQRAADALVELAKLRVGADADTDRASVVIHVTARDLNALNGNAMLEDGTFVPSEVARRLACDGRVQAVTYDEAGNPLNLGRRSRVVSRAQLRALKERDGQACVICGYTHGLEAHHVIPWAYGGRTDLDNLVLVCWRCHRLLHDRRFRLVRNGSGCMRLVRPDGRPVMNRPVPLRADVRERMLGPPTRAR